MMRTFIFFILSMVLSLGVHAQSSAGRDALSSELAFGPPEPRPIQEPKATLADFIKVFDERLKEAVAKGNKLFNAEKDQGFTIAALQKGSSLVFQKLYVDEKDKIVVPVGRVFQVESVKDVTPEDVRPAIVLGEARRNLEYFHGHDLQKVYELTLLRPSSRGPVRMTLTITIEYSYMMRFLQPRWDEVDWIARGLIINSEAHITAYPPRYKVVD